MNKVAVIDYGMGNLHSVAKAVEHVGTNTRAIVTSDAATILAADRVIFPGVGAMRDCMAGIRAYGVDELLRELVKSKPVLGICVGMQALLEHSDENNGVDCIGLFGGNVKRFPEPLFDDQGEHMKVPHMGWNNVSQTRAHPLWAGIADRSRFYFVHSYFAVPEDASVIMGQTAYPQPFTSAIARENIFAVQFHPEKSQVNGLQLLNNFIHWNGEGVA
ncbi:MAG: imidazole glycerol phosphate synthase subunit HisH [Pseudohongiellaceae bacterium]